MPHGGDADGSTWESEPAAEPQLGAVMNAFVDAASMSPTVNPQRTDTAALRLGCG